MFSESLHLSPTFKRLGGVLKFFWLNTITMRFIWHSVQPEMETDFEITLYCANVYFTLNLTVVLICADKIIYCFISSHASFHKASHRLHFRMCFDWYEN